MKVLQNQFWQLFIFTLNLIGISYFFGDNETFFEGSLFGLSTKFWLITALLIPFIHQLYVVVLWRLELHYKKLTHWWGDKAFGLFKVGFGILILSRPVSIICLAISNANTLNLDPYLAYGVAAILLLPAGYLFYSVKRYFGIDRAFGADHFFPEKYKNSVLIKKGIFKYTSNGMYVFGFLILWVPGFIWLSQAAIIAALYNHITIWGHYFFTEKPDMEKIYRGT